MAIPIGKEWPINDGKTVFPQLFEHIPMNDFRKAVRRYRGEYKVQKFSCIDQFLCMAFAQLTFREYLRDIETCLRTVRPNVMDRGYLDFKRLHAFSLRLAFFIIRAKTNLRCRRLDSKPVNKATGVRSDQTIVLTGINTAERYPDKLLRVRFFDVENKKKLVFLTNDFSLPPESIALLYKQRWQVELFFRWIMQHLRIKAFFGTSENAVKTQVWIAISVYVLVAIIKNRLHLKQSLYEIPQILSISV